jgi:CRP-like cAMP-binding protein
LKSTSISQLKRVINSVVSIPEDQWRLFEQNLAEREFEKGEYLLRAGEVGSAFFFVTRGLVRFFYSTDSGKEFNKHFAMENDFAGSFHSLLLQAPCGFHIQAIEQTSTIVLPNQVMSAFYDRHPCWERLGRKMAEKLLLVKEAREKELLLDSLDVRYQRFLTEFPGLHRRIPQYHIASFLGVTDVALSRLRGKNMERS